MITPQLMGRAIRADPGRFAMTLSSILLGGVPEAECGGRRMTEIFSSTDIYKLKEICCGRRTVALRRAVYLVNA